MTECEYLLRAEHVHKSYGPNPVLRDVSLSVSRGEVVCIIGPSGSGKSTLLRCINHLETLDAGRIYLEDELIGYHPDHRGRLVERGASELARQRAEMGMVFQQFNLFLHKTALENIIEAPVLVLKEDPHKAKQRARELLEQVGLLEKCDQYPRQLSGGQQQRVAIARALAYQPSILLMDEPFASVDAQTRGDLEDLVLRVREEFAVTILFVTHDIDESVYLSDRVVVLTHGPTEVKAVIDVDLPFPRDQIATKELPDFAHLRGHVYRLIKREQVESGEELAATLTTATKGDRQ
jgi:ABC-type nitrate/sulfonate/bicarbonate transport system ATPase subunit